MPNKYTAVLMFAALAIGVLLLFGLGQSAHAVTVKLNYSSSLDCGGADANEGTVRRQLVRGRDGART